MLLVYLANVFLSLGVCCFYGHPMAGLEALWLIGAAISTMSMLALAFNLCGLPCFWASRRFFPRASPWVEAGAWTLFHFILFIDTRIWAIFRYHINGMVWNLVTTPGGLQTFDLDAETVSLVTVGSIAMFAIQLLLQRRARASTPRSGFQNWIAKIGLILLVLAVLGEKSVFAWADAKQFKPITSRARSFPLYQAITAKRLFNRVSNASTPEEATREERLSSSGGLALNYPRAVPQCPPAGPRPNIVIAVVDSLRADAFSPEHMPLISEWSANRARIFQDHASGGNATRFGVFSLIYGLAAPYWFSIYGEHTPPALIVELQRLGYDMRVISTARMDFPEFRSTAWVTMQSGIKDRWGDQPKWRKDEMVAEDFESWVAARKNVSTPFFAFLMLDSPHQTYDWPRDKSRNTPFAGKVSYLKKSGQIPAAEITELKNAYFNAVEHADRVLQKIVDTLERTGNAENTWVILTGDHGEEFFENGYFGHTSNYARQQVHVPFLVAGPGIAPGKETRPSSHMDLSVTLLEQLGADPAIRGDWAQGENLFSLPDRRNRIVGGWHEVALWTDDGVLHVPLEGHRGFASPMDWDWKPHPDGEKFLHRHAPEMAKLARDLRVFLR
jgi:membrane-anchored protein YejM (alkaline phosphatase superfamily)